jgi:hypothetical protein
MRFTGTPARHRATTFSFWFCVRRLLLRLALENSGLVGAFVGWFFISFANAGFCAVIGTAVQGMKRNLT